MSNIVDDDLTPQIAVRVKTERERQAWSLADLAARSGVSKAMLSKIEREETSPTATILLRIATAFGHTLASFLSPPGAKPQAVLRAAEQPIWRDPASHYLRRQVFQSAENPLEMVEVQLPAGARVNLPASAYMLIRQVVWVLNGALTLKRGTQTIVLRKGDRFEFGPPEDTEFRNASDKECRYLVALVRR
jgi:transcriptional regulator with XRE-family HTH domain